MNSGLILHYRKDTFLLLKSVAGSLHSNVTHSHRFGLRELIILFEDYKTMLLRTKYFIIYDQEILPLVEKILKLKNMMKTNNVIPLYTQKKHNNLL